MDRSSSQSGEWSAQPRRVSPATAGERLLALALAAVLLGVLGLAAWLDPAPGGFGTHRQLGMHACPMLSATGRPCVTCGMTTAVSHAADGNLGASLLAQPFGLALALAAAVGAWVALHVAATGSRLGPVVRGAMGPKAAWLVVALLLASWGYKAWSMSGGGERLAAMIGEEAR